MKLSDAAYEYMKNEIAPIISQKSEISGAIFCGAIRAGRKKLDLKLTDNPLLRSIGLAGEIEGDTAAEFIEGMFDGRESVSVSMAEIVKFITGVESESPLLEGQLTLTRADADKFLALLRQ